MTNFMGVLEVYTLHLLYWICGSYASVILRNLVKMEKNYLRISSKVLEGSFGHLFILGEYFVYISSLRSTKLFGAENFSPSFYAHSEVSNYFKTS